MIHKFILSFIHSLTHMVLDHTDLCSELHVYCWEYQDGKIKFCLGKGSQRQMPFQMRMV